MGLGLLIKCGKVNKDAFPKSSPIYFEFTWKESERGYFHWRVQEFIQVSGQGRQETVYEGFTEPSAAWWNCWLAQVVILQEYIWLSRRITYQNCNDANLLWIYVKHSQNIT